MLSFLKSVLRTNSIIRSDRRLRHSRRFAHRWSQFGIAAEVFEDRCLLSNFSPSDAVYRPSTNTIFVDHNFDGGADEARVYGAPGDVYTSGDYNNDGLSDSAVLRNGTWFIDVTRDGGADFIINFGQAGDIPLIGDADGDGLANLILYRPSNGTWLIDNNGGGILKSTSVYGGQPGDIPVVGDLNGDGRLDRAIYRPSEGNWHVDLGFDGYDYTIGFGGAAVDRPFVADFNDDGFDDIGIFRDGIIYVSTTRNSTVTSVYFFGTAGDIPAPGYLNSRGVIHSLRPNLGIYRPSNGLIVNEFTENGYSTPARFFGGASVDQPVVADFNGNTVTDTAIFRDGIWYIDLDRNGSVDLLYFFGQAGDKAVAGDVNNDGVADLGIYRDGTWFIDTNRDGAPDIVSNFGQAGDIPFIGDFNNDGLADRAVYHPADGTWKIDSAFSGSVVKTVSFGGEAGDKPFAFDFNADGQTDIGVYRDGLWFIDDTLQGKVTSLVFFGGAGDVPIPGFFDPANSVFVRPGANGNGTEASPFGSITQALGVVGNGGFVRIAPGNYVENPRTLNQHNITIVGASRFYTNIIPSVGSAFGADTSSNIYLEDLTFASQDANTAEGRGVVVFRSSLWANGIRTSNNKNSGVFSAAPAGQFSQVTIKNSDLNLSQSGGGFYSQSNSIVRLDNVHADQNGTGSGTGATLFGTGIVLLSGTQATIRNSSGSFNADHGLIADGSVNVLVVNSHFDNNPNKNGGILNQAVHFQFIGTSFSNNGGSKARGAAGFNGLEIDTNSSGFGLIQNSTFNNNSAFGIFQGGGTNITVSGSNFFGNFVGIYVNGVNQGGFVSGQSNMTIVGNTFTPLSSAVHDEGVTATGPGATAIVGGAGSLKNIFDGFSGDDLPIHAINQGGLPVMQPGSGLSTFDDANDFPNTTTIHFAQT